MIRWPQFYRRLRDWFNANPAFGIAGLYVTVASLWILFSDRIAEWLFQSPHDLTIFQTYKGLGFVLVTTTFLYLLLHRQFRVRDDITRMLRETEERMRQAVSAGNVGLWDWDLQTNKVYYSPEWKRQIGYEGDEISDAFSEWQSRIHPDELDRVLEKARSFVAAPWPDYENEFRFRHKDGSYRWILAQAAVLYDAQGKAVRMLGSHIDITERKKAEQALRASESYLRAVISDTPVILFVLDSQGVMTLLQGNDLNRLDVEPDSFIGHSVFDTLDEFIPDLREHFNRALKGEEARSIQTLDQIVFDLRYSPLKDHDGEVIGVIGVATDITERFKLEKRQLELEQEQEIIALRERFVSMASHDFRTPLAIIKMSADMLDVYSETLPPERRAAKLRDIATQTDRMIALLDDVLAISKVNAGKIEVNRSLVDLEAFCRDVWADFEAQASQTHDIQLVCEVDTTQVLLDPKLMQLVLVNLLSNALKYTPPGGHVRLEAVRSAQDLVFRVRDDGIGIPAKDQPHLFEPFYRATNVREQAGTGLGLAIVKNYVEAQRGTITIESEEDRGTTLTVQIPLEVDVV